MKKKYVEPEIFFESFELNANVAGVCDYIAGHADSSSCSVDDSELGKSYFTNPSICEYSSPSEDDGICYHVAASAFSS